MVTSLSKGIVPLPSCLGHFPIIFAKYISRKFASFPFPLENSCHRYTAIWNSLSNRNMDGRVSGTRCNIPITFINLYSKCKKKYTTRTPSRYSRNDRVRQ